MSEPLIVAARIRPKFISQTEKQTCVHCDEDRVIINTPTFKKQFPLDFVFDSNSTQGQIYDKMGDVIINSIFEGIQSTVITYGRGKSGKTYTLFGKQGQQTRGLIPRVFSSMNQILSQEGEPSCMLKISCLYVMDENLYDLLNNQKKQLKLCKGKNSKGSFVQNLETKNIEKMEEIEGYLDYINQKKTMLHTRLGKWSSHCHTLFQVQLQMKNSNKINPFQKGKINFVELSTFQYQRQNKFFVQQNNNKAKLDLSSVSLQNIIFGLIDGNKESQIPYYDSSLTLLLRNSFGGDTRTFLLFCLDPFLQNYDETLKLMRVSQKALQIENNPQPKINDEEIELQVILREIQNLQIKLMDQSSKVYKENQHQVEKGLIYKNQFIPQIKEKDLRLSGTYKQKKFVQQNEVENNRLQKKLHALEKRLLKVQEMKCKNSREQIKENAKIKLQDILVRKNKKIQNINNPESSKELRQEKKQILHLNRQFQKQRQLYLAIIRKLEKKSSFYQQISENLLPKEWMKIVENNSQYNEQKREYNVPHFRIFNRRLEINKNTDLLRQKSPATEKKKLMFSPEKGRKSSFSKPLRKNYDSSKPSIEYNEKSSHNNGRIKSEQKSFFAPYLTRKTFKTGMKIEQKDNEYYQVVGELSKKKKSLKENSKDDYMYRSWSQKNV